ncbi:hypothetical protein GTP91_02790 [Rugamonas sp. FT82W]|uniref:Uncharacterized protein n=1 Tax=Duganella vulcania TaxID=2692166 RepID=A0A845FX22_9BURK|nr:hypothetical protein [Duganella vulcania]MYM86101.1 hypothetical protein [Duganella vulcania]
MNSPFFTSIIGAGLATLVGAWIAQKIAITSSQRDEMLKELRSVNLAITLAFSITNSFFSAKKQFVSALVMDYDESRKRFLSEFQARKFSNQLGREPIYVEGNFISFEFPEIPLSSLEQIILEKISIRTRPLAAFGALRDAYVNVNSSIRVRQSMLEDFKLKFSPYVYFAVKNGRNLDQRYAHTIEGIGSYTDDGIFFSKLLCEDLQKYGSELALIFKKKYKIEPPVMSQVNFSSAIVQGLMPFDKEYRSWMDGFVVPQSKISGLMKFILRIRLYTLFLAPTHILWVAVDFVFVAVFLLLAVIG